MRSNAEGSFNLHKEGKCVDISVSMGDPINVIDNVRVKSAHAQVRVRVKLSVRVSADAVARLA